MIRYIPFLLNKYKLFLNYLEVFNIPDMNKTELNSVIKHYVKNKDYESARNYVRSFGPQINNYDVEKKLMEIDELEKKEE